MADLEAYLRDNAARLLRAEWSSPQALAHELYAILAGLGKRGAPAAPGAPKATPPAEVQARRPAPGPVLPTSTPGPAAQAPAGEAASGGGDQAGGAIPFSALGPGPLVGGGTTNVFRRQEADPQFTQPHKALTDLPPYVDWGADLSVPGGGGGGGTSSFLGKVQSGSGDTYQVQLYPSGPDGTGGSTVQVKVPQMAAQAQIPAGTWIAPVMRMTGTDASGNLASLYFYQAPIWLT